MTRDESSAASEHALRDGMRWDEAVACMRRSFAEAGIDGAALDARLLAAEVLRTDAAGLLLRADARLDPADSRLLASHARRRLAGEPVGRILGRREFWGLPFRLGPETLEPRPDTETVVEAALELIGDRPARILDLGTGTGCILIALLHTLPGSWGLGVDRSSSAAAMARANARANGVGGRATFLCGDWAASLAGRFDLVVSNPPYITSEAMGVLDREVRDHDPAHALAGGPDGLDAYRDILAQLPRLLADGGGAVLEIGFDQAGALRDLAAAAGLDLRQVRRDLGGRDRAVTLVQREGLADGHAGPI